jgi:hypothetical protein
VHSFSFFEQRVEAYKKRKTENTFALRTKVGSDCIPENDTSFEALSGGARGGSLLVRIAAAERL